MAINPVDDSMDKLSKKEFKQEQKRILTLARKIGIKFKRGDISKAKPLSEICGKLKARYPYEIEDLLPGR
jgi:hypothetical protein